jgi:hypothetical protein
MRYGSCGTPELMLGRSSRYAKYCRCVLARLPGRLVTSRDFLAEPCPAPEPFNVPVMSSPVAGHFFDGCRRVSPPRRRIAVRRVLHWSYAASTRSALTFSLFPLAPVEMAHGRRRSISQFSAEVQPREVSIARTRVRSCSAGRFFTSTASPVVFSGAHPVLRRSLGETPRLPSPAPS